MNKSFLRRLDALEKRIKSRGEQPVWIDGKNATVRVDIGHKRGKEITFPTVYEARVWIEKQIDSHIGGFVGYVVDNIADLHENAEVLKATLKEIIPNGVRYPDMRMRLVNGKFVPQELTGPASHPDFFDAEKELPGILFGGGPPGAPADLRLWCLASLIKQCAWRLEYRERWNNFELTADDFRMYLVCLVLYVWHRPGSAEQLEAEFNQFFHQVTKLPYLVVDEEGHYQNSDSPK